MPSGSKPGERRGGRKKGTPNKFTGALKDMILTALDKAEQGGGVAYLTKQAKENPSAFMTLLGKVLPLQVAGEGGGPVTFYVVSWKDAAELPENGAILETGVPRSPTGIASPKGPPLLEHEPVRPAPAPTVPVIRAPEPPAPSFGSSALGKEDMRQRVYTVPAAAR